MKYLILIISIILTSFIANSQESSWIFCSKNSYGDSIFIKNNYIDKKGNIVKLWARLIYPKDKKTNKSEELLQIVEYDCDKKRMRNGHYWIYGTNKRKIEEGEDKIKNWSSVVPDTINELILQKVCSLFIK